MNAKSSIAYTICSSKRVWISELITLGNLRYSMNDFVKLAKAYTDVEEIVLKRNFPPEEDDVPAL